MTRKHYQAMAESLRFAHPSKHMDASTYGRAVEQWMRDVQSVADVFAADNSRFDRSRFLSACGLEQ
jgi:hypothetical protein